MHRIRTIALNNNFVKMILKNALRVFNDKPKNFNIILEILSSKAKTVF